MKESDLEGYLKGALERLNNSAKKIIETNGYTKETSKIKILSELIKEQINSENSSHTTRPIR